MQVGFVRVLLASALVVVSGCTGAAPSSVDAGVGADASTGGGAGGGSPDGGGVAPDAGGPRVMVRVGHAVAPDFLDLDVCFGAQGSAGITWSGPVWRDDWAHGITWGRVTSYRRIAPGPQLVRLVEHGDADCATPIVGLADQTLDVPLVASEHDAWFTLMALGIASGAGADALRIQTLVDRESGAGTPFGLRLVALDPARSPIELGSVPNADYSGYEPRIQSAAFGAPSPYASWTPTLPAPLYFGFKVFLQGQSAGTPLILGDRAQSDATSRGSWTVFAIPPRNGAGAEQWAFCSDGAEGPRLCYPCGTPACEGK